MKTNLASPKLKPPHRLAHLAASSVASTSAAPLPPLPAAYSTAQPGKASTSAGSSSADHEAWSDPAYLSRYRNPSALEGGIPKPGTQLRAPKRINAVQQLPHAVGNGNATPRARRLEMEAMWSGGEASPPIPRTHYRTVPSVVPHPKPHALLLPGIGAAYVGMASFLDGYKPAQEVWAEAQDALDGFEDWRRGLKLEHREGELGLLGRTLAESEGARERHKGLRRSVYEGPQDELIQPAISQPAILVTSIAFLRTLENEFGTPLARSASAILGHSSGEYAAAVAAESLSLHSATRLTRLHGLLTTAALSLPSINLDAPSPDSPHRAQMSALVLKPAATHRQVTEVVNLVNGGRKTGKGCQGWVEVASYNSAGQVVLAGSREGILSASEILRDLDLASHAADLPVSAPFHCSFLAPAAEGMQVALANTPVADPAATLLSSLDGTALSSAADVADALVAQITAPVQWAQALASLGPRLGVERLVFLGPGKALANLAKRDIGRQRDEGGFPSRREAGEGAGGWPTRETEGQQPMEVVSVATEADLGRVGEMWADEHGSEEVGVEAEREARV